MKVKNPKISKKISLGPSVKMEVQLDEKIVEAIKKEYNIDNLDEQYIQIFFRDVLHDAAIENM